MATSDFRPPSWRLLALRALFHLGTARLLLELALDGTPPEGAAGQLRSVESEVATAQGFVREIAGEGLDQADAELGMAWFNSLSERERAEWLKAADTSVPAEAWAHYKKTRGLS
jgi:hypothetical protein